MAKSNKRTVELIFEHDKYLERPNSAEYEAKSDKVCEALKNLKEKYKIEWKDLNELESAFGDMESLLQEIFFEQGVHDALDLVTNTRNYF